MFRRPVKDRPLALLRASVLVAPRNPPRALIPSIFSRDAIAKTLVLAIFRNVGGDLSVYAGSKIKREMHRGGVIRRNPPTQRLVAVVSSGKSRGMVFGEVIADFVHIRHEK